MGDDLYVGENLIMSIEIVGIEILAHVVERLHIVSKVDLVLDLHVFIMDVELDALVSNMDGCDKFHIDWLLVI